MREGRLRSLEPAGWKGGKFDACLHDYVTGILVLEILVGGT